MIMLPEIISQLSAKYLKHQSNFYLTSFNGYATLPHSPAGLSWSADNL